MRPVMSVTLCVVSVTPSVASVIVPPRSYGQRPSGKAVTGMVWSNDWAAQAACNGTDPDELFVQGAAQNRAKLICMGCDVRTECLADALDNRVEFGVWGGMTERERRALLRRRPEVTSWRRLLEVAREEHVRVGGVGDVPILPKQAVSHEERSLNLS